MIPKLEKVADGVDILSKILFILTSLAAEDVEDVVLLGEERSNGGALNQLREHMLQ